MLPNTPSHSIFKILKLIWTLFPAALAIYV